MGSRQRILLVDDSPVARAVVRMNLEGDYELIEAGSAARALQLLRLLDVALVVTDYNLPGGDGLGLVEALRRHARAEVREVPVVLISGEGGARASALEERSKEAGVAAFLRKPVAGSGLAELIRSLLPVAS